MPKLLLNDDKGGKPEGIHLVIGRRPQFAFGNTPGDQQMSVMYSSICWSPGVLPKANWGLRPIAR